MRYVRWGLILALVLSGSIGCQSARSTVALALPWVHPTPTGYAAQMRYALEGMRGWVGGVAQCFAPLRSLGLDRDTARDCHPKRLHRDGQQILRRLKDISPPPEVKSAHDKLVMSLEMLLSVIERRQEHSGATVQQQFQAITALEYITEALEEIGDFIGQMEGE